MRSLVPYLRYLRPYRGIFLGALLCGVIFGALSGVGLPVLIQVVMRRFFESDGAGCPNWQVWGLAVAVPCLFLLRGIFGFLNAYGMSYCGLKILYGLRRDIFEKLQQLPCCFFDKNISGDLLAKVWGDPTLVQNAILEVARELFRQPIQMFMAIGYLVYIAIHEKGDVLLFLFILGAMIPLCVLPARFIRNRVRSMGRKAQDASADATQCILENLDAVYEVRAFNLEGTQRRSFGQKLASYIDFETKLRWLENLQQPTMELIAGIIVGVIFAYAYYRHVPFSTFTGVGTALYLTFDPAKRISNTLNSVYRVHGAIERIQAILSVPTPPPTLPNPVTVDRLQGAIQFEKVDFSYDKKQLVLSNINVHVPAGTVCALVGASGAGKTTFAKLLPRFYEVNSGKITIDGTDIRRMHPYDLRRNIAIVSQAPFLFQDTLYNNIAVGNPQATREAIEAAAKAAFADTFIHEFPEGYQTLAGERGDRLSGGQKQRIALARAFLKEAPIVILDEATSALDAASEAYIQEALQTLMKGRTVLIIAHRLSTIRNADTILVFQGGSIVAQGNHSQLLESCTTYQELVSKQLGTSHP